MSMSAPRHSSSARTPARQTASAGSGGDSARGSRRVSPVRFPRSHLDAHQPATETSEGTSADSGGMTSDELKFVMERLLDEQEANAQLRKRIRDLEAQSQSETARQRQWPSFNYRQLLVERRRVLSVLHEIETHLSDAAVRECAQFVPETMELELIRQREEKSRLIRSTMRRLRGWFFVLSSKEEGEDIANVCAVVEDEASSFMRSFAFLRDNCNRFQPPPSNPQAFVESLREAEQLELLRMCQALIAAFDSDPDELITKHEDALLDLVRHESFLATLGRSLTEQGGDPMIADEFLPAPARELYRPGVFPATPGATPASSVASTPSRTGRPVLHPTARSGAVRRQAARTRTPTRDTQPAPLSGKGQRRSGSSGARKEGGTKKNTANSDAWAALAEQAQEQHTAAAIQRRSESSGRRARVVVDGEA